jgi:hypothetical protein
MKILRLARDVAQAVKCSERGFENFIADTLQAHTRIAPRYARAFNSWFVFILKNLGISLKCNQF